MSVKKVAAYAGKCFSKIVLLRIFQSNLTQKDSALIKLSNFVKLYDLMKIMPEHDSCFNFSRWRIDLFQYIKMLSRLVASRQSGIM